MADCLVCGDRDCRVEESCVLSGLARCLVCGCWIDGRQDYCAACWDDVLDWLGW